MSDCSKKFPVFRMSNRRGDSNLLAIINEAVEDIYIGDAVLVPSVSGEIDPTHVLLEVDKRGKPLRNKNIAIVKEYIYE